MPPSETVQPCECGRVVPEGEHHCWFHHADEHPTEDTYQVCGECWHVYQTAADLEAAWDGPHRTAAEIYSCPECAHDF